MPWFKYKKNKVVNNDTAERHSGLGACRNNVLRYYRTFGRIFCPPSIRHSKKAIRIAQASIDKIEQTFFMEKKLLHSKNIVNHHLKHRSQLSFGFVECDDKHSYLEVKISTPDNPPEGYEFYRDDCDVHLACDKYQGILENEKKTFGSVGAFNDEAKELIDSVIKSIGDLPPEFNGKDPNPRIYSNPPQTNISYALKKMFDNGQVPDINQKHLTSNGTIRLSFYSTFIVDNAEKKSGWISKIEGALNQEEVWDALNSLRAFYDDAIEQIQKFHEKALDILGQVESEEMPLDGKCDRYHTIEKVFT